MPLDDNASYVLAVNRGVLRIRQERFEDAITDLRSAIERKPKAFQAYVNMAQAYRRLGKLDPALEALQRATELEPGLAHLYRLRPGSTWSVTSRSRRLGDFDQAIGARTRAVRTRPTTKSSGAGCCSPARSTSEALESFDAALALQKDHSPAQRLRAETLFRLGRFEEVIAAFDRYLETGKPLESVYRGRGLARAELGQYPGAIDDFTKALELHPTSAVQAFRGGRTWSSTRPSWRMRDFELALELDPKSGDAYSGRGFVPRQPGPPPRGDRGCRGSPAPGAAVAAIAVQCRKDRSPVPRPRPEARHWS